MKTLEQEAQFLKRKFLRGDINIQQIVFEVANSKWVQAEKIKAQIEVCKDLLRTCISGAEKNIVWKIEDLKTELRQLEDETKI